MKKNKRIGIFGGAFDPIHRGHLEAAAVFFEKLALDEIRFIPCQQALLKEHTVALPWQRAAMVALAIVNYPHYILDTRELKRSEPSYSLYTLQSLRETFSSAEFFLLMGDDAYVNFTQWYRWEAFVEYTDLVVISRMQDHWQNNEVDHYFRANGRQVIHLTMPKVEVASSGVRSALHKHMDDLPDGVREYILENRLYT